MIKQEVYIWGYGTESAAITFVSAESTDANVSQKCIYDNNFATYDR